MEENPQGAVNELSKIKHDVIEEFTDDAINAEVYSLEQQHREYVMQQQKLVRAGKAHFGVGDLKYRVCKTMSRGRLLIQDITELPPRAEFIERAKVNLKNMAKAGMLPVDKPNI